MDSERLKSSLADLAREVQIQTQRATTAESALTALRGEVVALRRALDRLWEWFRYSDQPIEQDAAIVIRSAQLATRTAAALGALVEAALEERQLRLKCDRIDAPAREIVNAYKQLNKAQEKLNAAVDAVLAQDTKEVRT